MENSVDELTEADELDLWMMEAFYASFKSTCHHIAGCAVFNKEKGIVGIGWSGAPPKAPHCIDPGIGCILEGFGNQKKCKRAVSAIRNAVEHFSDKRKLSGAWAFITRRPEEEDLNLLLDKGIKKIFYADNRTDNAIEENLKNMCEKRSAHISNIVFDPLKVFSKYFTRYFETLGLHGVKAEFTVGNGNGDKKK